MTIQISIAKEISRKIFHLFLLFIPYFYYQQGKWFFLTVFAPIACIIFAIDYFRHKNQRIEILVNKIFGSILREKEKQKGQFTGTTYVFLAAVLLAFACREEIFVTAFAILAISDAAASIIGRSFASKPFFEKSTAGSAAFYISGLLVLFFCGAIFKAHLWFYLFGFFALFCATIIEARPSFLKIDDNFTIPVSFAVIMSFFDLIWNFL